ncbi:hypothetical protein KDM87_03690 [Undibacterium sp. FT147W]|uniref:Uncharacterized protein n=1 Tax=Undibacterium rivi TaxID=2828729 RepID=A0ABS5GYZ4_9BURK|nr:hypothetical protein [Undibacterium rivi]MBR7791685.1 hypothetical protein [Undibacterium rivi]
MGVKMSKARDASGNDVSLEQAQFNPRAFRQCANCSSEVVYNAGSNPERNGRSVVVPHYFKLKKNVVHQDTCTFNVLGQVKTIAAAESTPEFIGQFNNGVYELRLLLPEENDKKREVDSKLSEGADATEARPVTEKKYVSVGRLNAYLNTAARVMKLRAFCEENSEIENHLILKFGTSKVFWKDFFFEIADYKRLYRILGKMTDPYPVAVSGKIDKITRLESKYQNGSPYYWLISLDQPYEKPDENGVVNKTSMAITVYDERFLDGLKVDDDVVVFGVWTKKNVTRKPNSKADSKVKFWENLPLNFHLTHHKQITVI